VPPFPRRCVSARVMAATFGLSGKDNKQVVLDCEIMNEEKIEAEGKTYNLAGTKFRLYLPLEGDTIDKTFGFHSKVGLPDSIDDENPDTKAYVKVDFDILLSSREKKAVVADPNNKGKFIPYRDAAGNEVLQGYEIQANVDDVLGPATYSNADKRPF